MLSEDRQYLRGRDSQLSTLEFQIEHGVATVTLNCPNSNNSLNQEMAAELRFLASDLAANDTVRVVILAASGAVFSTGREKTSGPEQMSALQVCSSLAALPVPVLAALNGDASDHGLELALAADLRVAAAEARFWCSPPSAGSLAFDGATQRLPRLVGPGWARDMLLTGRRLSAREALGIGLVNRVVADGADVLGATRQLATEISEGSALGARFVKESVVKGADMSLAHALGLEADLNVILQSTADRAEGIASFLERRPPRFTGK